MTIRDVLDAHGISIADFARRFGIPYNTACNWCLPPDRPNARKCPSYVVDMVNLILEHGLK